MDNDMLRPTIGHLFTFLIVATSLSAVAAGAGTEHGHEHGETDGKNAPVYFIENKGQLPSNVQYRADIGVLAMFLERDRITWSKLQDDAGEAYHDMTHAGEEVKAAFALKGHAWYMDLVGASHDAEIIASDRADAYLNYFIGNDPTKWASHVGLFTEVRMNGLWPGIDMRYYGTAQGLKYDLLLDAHADASAIAFDYTGLDGLELNENGDLVIRTSVGDLVEMRPIAWYADGDNEHVPVSFELNGTHVAFAFGRGVDHGRPIVIDPLLIASTLSGTGNIGTTQNYGHTATYDDAGNIYTGAICFGQGYPTTPGAFDAIFGGGFGVDIAVSKLNPDGSNLIYATYLGGGDDDYPHSLVVTPNNELTVYGSSHSTDYPVTANAFDGTHNGSADIVVTKLDPTGSTLVGSTFMGGSNSDGQNSLTFNYGDDYRGEVETDPLGNIYVSSCTYSAGFPTTPGAYQPTYGGGQDGVVFSLNPDLSALNWSTIIGTASGDEMAFGLKLDGSGGVFVCGATDDPTFPTTPGAYQTALQGSEDGFVIHLTGGGTTLTSSTLFGGATGEDDAFFIQLDQNGDVYIYGQSDGGIAIQPAGTFGDPGGDIFIAKFDPGLTTALFTSTIGAGGFGTSLVPVAFLVDVCDHIYVSGYSATSSFPTTPGALYTTGGFYLAAYDIDMAGLLYATYYSGANHVDGGTSRFDDDGIIYQAVCTSGGFPTTPTAFSSTQPSSWDVGVFKIDFQVAGVNAAGAGTLNQGCAPIQIDFSNSSTGNEWVWDFGDGSPTVNAFEPSYTYTTPGAYTVTLIAYDSLSCNLADTIQFPITIGQAQPLVADMNLLQTANCTLAQVEGTNLSTGAPLAFIWDMGDGTQYTDTNVVHNYAGPGSYDVQLLVYDPTGCSMPDSVSQTLTILPPDTVTAQFTVDQIPDCADMVVTTSNTSTGTAPTFSWDMGDGTLLSGQDVTHTYIGAGNYLITLIALDSATCNIADTVTYPIQVDPITPVVADMQINDSLGCGELFITSVNSSTGSNMVFSWDMGNGTVLADTNITYVYSVPGTYTIVLTVSDVLGCAPPEMVSETVVLPPTDPIQADFTLAQTNDCTDLEVTTVNTSTGSGLSYLWDMGNGTTLTDTNVVYTYSTPGTYSVSLTIADQCGNTSQVDLPVTLIETLPVVISTDGVVCPGLTTDLTASSLYSNMLWNTGDTSNTITVSAGGQYIVQVFTPNCSGSDTVQVLAVAEQDLSSEMEACPNAVLTLTIPMAGTAYSWSTGGTGRTTTVIGDGEYAFTVVDANGCLFTDTIVVHPLDAEALVFMPNAFTPDGDGINDEFRIQGHGSENVDWAVYDRWGERIFEANSLNTTWDGTYNGEPVKQDVYVYVLKYNAHCAQNDVTTARGHITVLR